MGEAEMKKEKTNIKKADESANENNVLYVSLTE